MQEADWTSMGPKAGGAPDAASSTHCVESVEVFDVNDMRGLNAATVRP